MLQPPELADVVPPLWQVWQAKVVRGMGPLPPREQVPSWQVHGQVAGVEKKPPSLSHASPLFLPWHALSSPDGTSAEATAAKLVTATTTSAANGRRIGTTYMAGASCVPAATGTSTAVPRPSCR